MLVLHPGNVIMTKNEFEMDKEDTYQNLGQNW